MFGYSVQPDFFETVGQRLLAGRTFTDEEVRDGSPVYIVGETAARVLWPGEDAVGKRVQRGRSEWNTVVGVVEDVVALGLGSTMDRMQLYVPASRNGAYAMFPARVSGDPGAALSAIREALRAVEPEAPVELAEVVSYLDESIAPQRFTMRLLAALAALASILACVGLYGVVSQTVERRTREIGIRMSLGARAQEITVMILMASGFALTVGISVGRVLVVAGGRVVESHLYGVETVDPLTLVGAGLLLAVAALLATAVPAKRAARVDPLEAIGGE